MIRYAEIDNNNVCYAVSDMTKPINKPTLIRVNGSPIDYLGKKWNGNEWETVEPVPEPIEYTEPQLMNEYSKGVETIG